MLSNRFPHLIIPFALILLSGFSQAQVVTSQTVVVQAPSAMGGFIGGNLENGPGVTGKPYCADVENTRTQVLADGNRITNTNTGRVCRDSQGRTRTETTTSMALPGSKREITRVMIVDPIANTVYSFSSQGHTATKRAFMLHRTPDGTLVPLNPPRQAIPHRNVQGPSGESLGNQTINGIFATGTRTSHTTPAGAVGNEQPLTTYSERWYSDDLGLNVFTKTSDPRMGEMVREMKNVTREEPDPSLFQVPADYTIEETTPHPLP